jgi:hypothetical protein
MKNSRPVREIEIINNWSENHRRLVIITKLRDRGLTDAEIHTLGITIPEESSRIKKEHLLLLAKEGSVRPNSCSKDPEQKRVGKALVEYTNLRSSSYDSEFDSAVRSLRPEWFEDTARTNKTLLLSLAQSGKPKPKVTEYNKSEEKLARTLKSYMNKAHRSYDPEFSTTITKLRPIRYEISY